MRKEKEIVKIKNKLNKIENIKNKREKPKCWFLVKISKINYLPKVICISHSPTGLFRISENGF